MSDATQGAGAREGGIGAARRYLPIAAHAVVGDRRSAALVARNGAIDWLCWPNYDSSPVFGALLDAERGGICRLGPVDATVQGEQSYIERTVVVVTRWCDAEGELELTDGMPWPDREEASPDSTRRVLIRRLRCVRGRALCGLELAPRDDFGKPIPIAGIAGWIQEAPQSGVDWLGCWTSNGADASLARDGRLQFALSEGETLWVVLGWREEPTRWTAERAASALEETIDDWQRWARRHEYLGPRRTAVERSVLTIRLLAFAPTGALVAAPTSSLPERIAGDRNYDYRYAWVRDASLALAILIVMGDSQAAEHYMDWLAGLDTSTEMPLQVLYRIDGGMDVGESKRDELDGYRGSKPVRFGNHAFRQFQLDSLGYFADCAEIYLREGGRWKPEYWRLVERIAEFTVANWRRPDNGIWEQAEVRHYVSSKIMSWVVLERSCRIATKLDMQVPQRWRVEMEALRNEVLQRGWSDRLHALRRDYDSDELDASVLLASTMDFLPGDDPRLASTVKAIRENLEINGLVFRFHPRSAGRPELPLGGVEGAFLPCTFWLASTLARMGRRDEADKVLDRVETVFGTLALLPEEVDPGTGEALGNMPLVFSHAEHLKAVMDRAKASVGTHAMLAAGMMWRKAATALP